jgi:hypothetical protein
MSEDQDTVFDAWLAECVKNGLLAEVAIDVLNSYFHRFPEACLEDMHHSMMDWDF